MAKSWIVDCRGIANKIRNATFSSAVQTKDCGAKRECPKCHYWIDNTDVACEWPGLPTGVKFDPSDAELLDHLAAKCCVGDAESHVLIDEFIPTLETDKGICHTHPKYLPGARKDGTSVHFFHKTSNAYASGQRKRRKIDTLQNEEAVRWHKTGKTKPVFDNGIQKGCKKIMVLYRSSRFGSKPVKSNWVMHQYHLGTEEDEREGEFVVSKIYYQQQKSNEKKADCVTMEDSNLLEIPSGPKTPIPSTPYPLRTESSIVVCDDVGDDKVLTCTAEEGEYTAAICCFPQTCSQYGGYTNPSNCLPGESQAPDVDPNDIDDPLLCREIFNSSANYDGVAHGTTDLGNGGFDGVYGINDLKSIELDTPPEFSLPDLQFGSQDSIFDWLDRL